MLLTISMDFTKKQKSRYWRKTMGQRGCQICLAPVTLGRRYMDPSSGPGLIFNTFAMHVQSVKLSSTFWLIFAPFEDFWQFGLPTAPGDTFKIKFQPGTRQYNCNKTWPIVRHEPSISSQRTYWYKAPKEVPYEATKTVKDPENQVSNKHHSSAFIVFAI